MLTGALGLIDAVARETLLFAAFGFLVGGIDDMVVDLLFGWRLVRKRLVRPAPLARLSIGDYPVEPDAGRIALFVAAWDEAAVIGDMLAVTLARLDYPDYRIYVGTYPNDCATIDAVAAIATGDDRIRLVIGPDDGPTTKAGCLNTLWHALVREERAGEPAARAVVIHDAEDLVHPAELRIFDRLIRRHWAVQLPVLPLVDQGSRWVSGHYCDEFAEAHAKQLVVRQVLGAGLPLAGVGCAIARQALDAIAARRGGSPFDADSLTEDYELGLAIAALGGSGIIARIPEVPGGPVAAVRAYFPATLDAAVKQKARWMTGIAFAGWDRIGWSRGFDLVEHWMRMRDRRAPLAVLVTAAAYLALVSWAFSLLLHWLLGVVPPPLAAPPALLAINMAMLAWRLMVRAVFTGRAYGRVEAMRSVPRALVGNIIALLAARRAVMRYISMLRGRSAIWDKTAHKFPELGMPGSAH